MKGLTKRAPKPHSSTAHAPGDAPNGSTPKGTRTKARRVGIDLGATAVRVAEVSGIDENATPIVTTATILTLPPGAIMGGRIVQPALVADTVKRALKKAKLSGYGAVVGLSSPDVALSVVSMPVTVEPDKYASMLRLQDKQISPRIPLEDALLSFNRIPGAKAEDGQVVLAVSAALRSEVENLLETCSLAGVTPRAVDLAAAATFRGITALPSSDQSGVSTLVDIGSSSTTVATRLGLRLRSVRTVEIGGDAVTRAVQGALSVPFEQAEAVKKSLRVGEPANGTPKSAAAQALASAYGSVEETSVAEEEDSTAIAQRAVTAASDQLVEEIASAIESDAAANPERPTASVTLCGRGALLHGLAARVENRIGISTFVRRPYMRVVASSKTNDVFINGSADPARMLEVATAVGLAAWKEGM